jgi:hypothetical protein
MRMTIVFRNDSDNQIYQLWAQDQAASCAVASIWMARNQAKQMTINEEEWTVAWSMYCEVVEKIPLCPEPAPVTFDPTQHQNDQSTMGDMFSVAGTYMSQVSTKLQLDGLNVTNSSSTAVIPSQLSYRRPAIILLGWYTNGVRNGGHFIVASQVNSHGAIVYLDPWGGELREMGPGPSYIGNGQFENILYVSAN